MRTRVIAAGGGGREDSLPLDQQFAQWVGKEGRLLYWPMALPPTHPLRATCYDFICSVFHPLGMQHIDMWQDFATHTVEELDDFDALYIGGGNTYLLLHLLCMSGFDAALTQFIQAGKPVYGGSAGAAILGYTIETVVHMDQNDVGLQDLHGLDVLDGYSIWCHYTPGDMARIDAFIAKHGRPLLAIGERAGVGLEDGLLVLAATSRPSSLRHTAWWEWTLARLCKGWSKPTSP